MKEGIISSESRLTEPRFSEMSKPFTVSIFGEEYQLKSTESSEHIMRIAQDMDKTMRYIAQAAPAETSVHHLAILAALRITSERLHQEEKLLALINRELTDFSAS